LQVHTPELLTWT